MPHTPPIFINYGKNSSAFITLNHPTSLVVFVHGFNGSATATWDDFPNIVRTNDDFANSDIVFYGYESLKGQANNNAVKFYNFLKSACDNSRTRFGFTQGTMDEGFTYNKVLIVAHSLGAIIVRRALLHSKSENKDWLDRCRMVLFAPAHKGARIQKLVGETLPTLGKIFAGLGFLAMPVLDDLRPDSQTVLNLINDSQKYINNNEGGFTVAHSVIWAGNDIVVHNDTFCHDPVATVVDGKSHTSVCKPHYEKYKDPFTIVTNAL